MLQPVTNYGLRGRVTQIERTLRSETGGKYFYLKKTRGPPLNEFVFKMALPKGGAHKK